MDDKDFNAEEVKFECLYEGLHEAVTLLSAARNIVHTNESTKFAGYDHTIAVVIPYIRKAAILLDGIDFTNNSDPS